MILLSKRILQADIKAHTDLFQTLLGSSFFNFKPAGDSSIVSAWSWLYWVITVILTAAVLVGWFFVSRVQNKKMKKQLGNNNGGTELHSLHAHAITGFWTSRGDSAIWDERPVRAEETGSHESVRGVQTPDTQCGVDAALEAMVQAVVQAVEDAEAEVAVPDASIYPFVGSNYQFQKRLCN